MSELIDAIKKKNANKVRELLDRGVNVNEVDENGETALFHAARWGRGDVIERLLDAGADWKHTNKLGKTAAPYSTSIDATQLLDVNGNLLGRLYGYNFKETNRTLKWKPDLNTPQAYTGGKTFLRIAVETRDLGLPYVDALLTAGADPNIADDQGSTPLLIATQKKAWDIVERLLQVPGIDVNKAHTSGNAPILFVGGKPTLVKRLLDAGANPEVRGVGGLTAYIVSIAYADNVSASNILAKAIANGISKDTIVNAKDEKGLNAAFYVKNEEGVNQVVSDGVDINARSNGGETPLIYAIRTKRDPAAIIALLNNGVDVNVTPESGTTALILAAASPGYAPVIRLLLDKGANVNAQDKRGNTPLMSAASIGNTEYVNLLLERGADKTLKDATGKTAYNYASHPDIKELLSDEPKPMWAGITSSDASMFDTFFEDKVNWSCCPVCLAYVQRSEACRYMSHNCNRQTGVMPHRRLYDMYRNDMGVITWCTVCGRICKGHRHYLAVPQSSNQLPQLAPIQQGVSFFGGEQECIRDGGGGFAEKVPRFEGMLTKLKALQADVGKVTERQARRLVVEAAWDAPFNSVPSQQVLQTGKFTTRPEEFPAPPAPAPSAPEAPAPDVPKPADELANVPEVNGEGGFDTIMRYDTAPIIRFVHKKKDGTVYRHTDQELVSKEGLEAFIGNQNINFGTEKFGYCFAPGCDAKLWPQDITDFLDDREIFEDYRKKFNRKFAAKVGGQGKNFLVKMTNAECALPEKKKAGRKTYRRKGRMTRKKTRRHR